MEGVKRTAHTLTPFVRYIAPSISELDRKIKCIRPILHALPVGPCMFGRTHVLHV